MNGDKLQLDNFLTFQLDKLTYNIRPLNLSDPTHLRCVVSVTNKNGYNHLDRLDLYKENSRRIFAKKAQPRMEAGADMIQQDLVRLTGNLEKLRTKEETQKEIELPPMQKQETIKALEDPDLVNNTIRSFHKCGYIGEDLNLLTAFLVVISRKLLNPLSLIIISRSGAGKSFLQDTILEASPEEDYQLYTRMTDQVLYYKEKNELRHKLIAIEEEHGIRGATYSLRNLLTSHGLSVNTTIKDPLTGVMKAMSHKVYGPVALMLTTTALEHIDYELLNRFIIITIDESQKQTELILAQQRRARSLSGLISRRNHKSELLLIQNIQRLLKPVEIVNPYYDQLKFDERNLIMRRRHLHYLGIIDAVTLLHQYQRPIKKAQDDYGEFEYIEVTPRDIDIANKVAERVLPCSHDELMPPVRNFYKELLKLEEEIQNGNGSHPARFNRKLIRDKTGWNYYQVDKYIKQLTDFEYVGIVNGTNGIKYEYELLYHGNGNKPIELIDPKSLIIKTS